MSAAEHLALVIVVLSALLANVLGAIVARRLFRVERLLDHLDHDAGDTDKGARDHG